MAIVDPVDVALPSCLLLRGIEVGRRTVDVRDRSGSGPKQVVVDRTDAATDVEHGLAPKAVGHEPREQPTLVGREAVTSIRGEVPGGNAFVETSLELGAAAWVHGRSLRGGGRPFDPSGAPRGGDALGDPIRDIARVAGARG